MQTLLIAAEPASEESAALEEVQECLALAVPALLLERALAALTRQEKEVELESVHAYLLLAASAEATDAEAAKPASSVQQVEQELQVELEPSVVVASVVAETFEEPTAALDVEIAPVFPLHSAVVDHNHWFAEAAAHTN